MTCYSVTVNDKSDPLYMTHYLPGLIKFFFKKRDVQRVAFFFTADKLILTLCRQYYLKMQ